MMEIIISGMLATFVLGLVGSISKDEFLPFAVSHISFLSIGILAFLHLPIVWYPIITPVLMLLLDTSGSTLALSISLGIALYLLSGSHIPLTTYLIGSYDLNIFLFLGLLLFPLFLKKEVLLSWFFPQTAEAAGISKVYRMIPLIFIGIAVSAAVQSFGMLFVAPLTIFPAQVIKPWTDKRWSLTIFSLAAGAISALAFLVSLLLPQLPLGISITLILILFKVVSDACHRCTKK